MKSLILTWALLVSSFVQAAPPTGIKGQDGTINYSVNAIVPYNQATKLAGNNVLIETGSENMLINGGFESSTSLLGWTNSGSTDTIMEVGTDPDKVSSGKRALQLTTTAGNSLNLYQSVATPSGIQKQGVVGLLYKSALSTFQVCSLVDGAEQSCVPSANLILDGLYHSIEIPIVFGTTSAGIKVKSGASSGTQGHYIDAAYVRQGIGYQNLALEDVYSAVVSSAGVISDLNKTGWLSGNCSVSATSTFDCPIATGLVTQKMNCTATPNGNSTSYTYIPSYNSTASTASNAKFYTTNSTSAVATAIPFTIHCQKSGNDYLAASAAVYSSSNSLRSTTLFSLSGTTTSGALTNENQDFANGNGTAANGTAITFNSGIFTVAPNCQATPTGTSTAVMSISGLSSTGVTVTSYNPATLALQASQPFILHCQKQGVDYTNAFNPTIAASLAGTPKVPGYDGNVDTFSVTYSGGGADSSCIASPCTIDQIGTAVLPSGFTRSGAGVYTMGLVRTYGKLKCSIWIKSALGNIPLPFNGGSCSTCSSLSFNTYTSAPAASDSSGTLICQGSY